MEVLEQMRMLLREKAILFGQYEQETLRLDTDDLDAVDDIVDAVQARQALIDKINGLDRRIAAIGEASAYGAHCFHIGKNQCDYAGLTEAEQAVFRVAGGICHHDQNPGAGRRNTGKDGSDSGTAPGKDKKE